MRVWYAVSVCVLLRCLEYLLKYVYRILTYIRIAYTSGYVFSYMVFKVFFTVNVLILCLFSDINKPLAYITQKTENTASLLTYLFILYEYTFCMHMYIYIYIFVLYRRKVI